ncbi:MAG: hypothetical protein JRH11_05175 [Deltaproteobacteria bacterium]|nr:hypothetical protein [Deltaproteobacteria bacterium]
MARIAFAFLMVLAGCGGDDVAPDAGDGGMDTSVDADADAGPSGAMAVFAPPATGSIPWEAIPFPHDLFLGEDGTVDIASLPSDTPMWESVRERLNLRDGFCTTCGGWFPIDGVIDPASMPTDAGPGDVASASDPIVMLDLEDATLIPMRYEWNDQDGLVVVMPAWGFALRHERTYAIALTSQLLAEDGSPVSPSPVFELVRDGDSGGGPEADRARPIVGPALDAFESAGVGRGTIVAAAVFTTDEPLEDLRAARDLVMAADPPEVTATDRRYGRDDGSLDALLGTPSDGRPGLTTPMMGTTGVDAVIHDTTLVAVKGTFESIRVVERTGMQAGYPRRGASGAIEAGPVEEVPFVLIIPEGVDVTNLPVLIFHHGGFGNMEHAFLVAEAAGRAGMAVIAIDGFLQGARAEGASDFGNDLRDTDEPNGFSRTTAAGATDGLLAIFGLTDEEAGRRGSPLYFVGWALQLIADQVALQRLLTDGDLSRLAAADPALTGLSFDESRIGFTGVSLGGSVGSGILSVTDVIDAAVLNVAPVDASKIGCYSPGRGNFELFGLYRALGVRGSFDEQTRRTCFHPNMILLGWAYDPINPATFQRRLFLEPGVVGSRPDVLFQYGGHDETIGVILPDAWLAAAGVPGHGEYAYADVVDAGSTPIRENLTTPSGDVTAAAWRFPMADHFMAAGYARFFDYEAPLEPPFVERAEPLSVTNPVIGVHRQLEHFFETRMTTGRAEICDPDGDCPAW